MSVAFQDQKFVKLYKIYILENRCFCNFKLSPMLILKIKTMNKFYMQLVRAIVPLLLSHKINFIENMALKISILSNIETMDKSSL